MHKGLLKFVCVLALTTMATIWASPVRAQMMDDKEKPPVYTYVAEWAVPRASWPAYEKSIPGTKALMDKLVADGTIVGYGWFKTLVHQEGQPTHGDWFSATSNASLMKALAAIMAQGASDGDKVLAESKHWDYVVVSRQYGNHAGTFENSYLRVSSYKIKVGEGETFDKVAKAYIVPRLEKLLADGAIHFYSIDREIIHTGDPAEVDIVVITNGADGLDKFYASLEAAAKANPTGSPAFGSVTDGSAHRDSLSLTTAVFK
ncbi:MAG: hypothetical protein ACRD5M_16765 [Candidatus Acidiferrales bacterium]